MKALRVIKPKDAKYYRTSNWKSYNRTWLFTFYNSKMKVVATKRLKLHANISKTIQDLSPLDYYMLKRKYKKVKRKSVKKTRRK